MTWKRILMFALFSGLLCGLVTPLTSAFADGRDEADLTADLRIGRVGITYYVSSSRGGDGNDGLTPTTAFASFAPFDHIILGPGDCVLLRRGDTWHERLTIRGSGRADAWIFVGSYGEEGAPMPEISLDCERDDICILVSDILGANWNENGFDYIWIDGIRCADATLGIYFRSAYSAHNTGVRVTNCVFDGINCPDLMREALTSTAWLSQPKGHLPTVSDGRVLETGGGEYEYIWPTAICFGGRPIVPLASKTLPGLAQPTTKVSQVELYQNAFYNSVTAVASNAYAIHYGTGPDQCFTYTTKWRVRGLVSENTMMMFNIDCADFGWDGTDGSEWGLFENVSALSGMADFSMSAGTTQAMFADCKNLYIRDSRFNGCRNNGQPDGCGFDFERSVFHFLLERCVFAENEGQPVLMMQTTMENQVTHEQVTTENGDCTLKNCLFYDNFRNVWNQNYCFDFLMFNPQNTDISITGCAFYEPAVTRGNACVRIDNGSRKMRAVGPEHAGVTYTDNEEHIGEQTLPELSGLIEARGLQNATRVFSPTVKSRDDYVGDVPSVTDVGTEVGTRPDQPDTQTDGDGLMTSDTPASGTEKAPDVSGTAADRAPITEPDGTAGATDPEPDAPTGTASDGDGGCVSLLGAAGVLPAVPAALAVRKRKRRIPQPDGRTEKA